MSANSIFNELPVDLHTVICKYNKKAIYVLPKDRLITYNWKYLIKAVFGINYDSLPKNLIMAYYDLSKSKFVFTGLLHTLIQCADGKLMACGHNSHGQLGLGDLTLRTRFVPIINIPKNVTNVVCGLHHTIIKLSDGTLMVCGLNDKGQLGIGNTISKSTFTKITGIPKNIVQIVAEDSTTILRCIDGTIMTCGWNMFGQLGLGDRKDRSIFEKVGNIPTNVVDVIHGYHNTILRCSDGTLFACGENKYGILGFGHNSIVNTFKQIPHIPTNVIDVYLNLYYTIIRCSNGQILACGRNTNQQSGFINYSDIFTFEKITGIPENVVEVACSLYHTILRCSDGKIFARGSNSFGQLGLGDTVYRSIFVEIKKIPDNITNIFCCVYSTIIKYGNGKLMICGDIYRNNSSTQYITVFREIVELQGCIADIILPHYIPSYGYGGTTIGYDGMTYGYGGIKSVSMSVCQRIIIKPANSKYFIPFVESLLMRGRNNYGQLGLGDTHDRSRFVEIKNINVLV